MSKNRFWFVIDKGKLEYVQDNVTGEKITVSELEDLLNEQQEMIDQLEKENTNLIELAEKLGVKIVVVDDE